MPLNRYIEPLTSITKSSRRERRASASSSRPVSGARRTAAEPLAREPSASVVHSPSVWPLSTRSRRRSARSRAPRAAARSAARPWRAGRGTCAAFSSSWSISRRRSARRGRPSRAAARAASSAALSSSETWRGRRSVGGRERRRGRARELLSLAWWTSCRRSAIRPVASPAVSSPRRPPACCRRRAAPVVLPVAARRGRPRRRRPPRRAARRPRKVRMSIGSISRRPGAAPPSASASSAPSGAPTLLTGRPCASNTSATCSRGASNASNAAFERVADALDRRRAAVARRRAAERVEVARDRAPPRASGRCAGLPSARAPARERGRRPPRRACPPASGARVGRSAGAYCAAAPSRAFEVGVVELHRRERVAAGRGRGSPWNGKPGRFASTHRRKSSWTGDVRERAAPARAPARAAASAAPPSSGRRRA